jgi:dihydroceramidase
MFLAVGSLLHQLMCYEATPAQRQQYTVAILGSVIPVSIYHVWADEIYVHEVTFAVMIFLVGRRLRHLITRKIKTEEGRRRIRNMLTMGLGRANPDDRLRGSHDDLLIMSQALVSSATFSGTSTSIYATTSQRSSTTLAFLGAFCLSYMVCLCSYERACEMLTDLLGWWHFGTSICSYISMSIAEYLTTIEDGDTGRIEEGFIWPVKAVLRDLDKIERKGTKKVQ